MNIPDWTGRSMPVYLGGLLKWLARLVANRRVSLALVAAVVIVDFTIPWHGMSFVRACRNTKRRYRNIDASEPEKLPKGG